MINSEPVVRWRNNRERRSSVSWLLATTLRMCKSYPDDCLQMSADGRRRSAQRIAAVNQLQATDIRRGNPAAVRRRGSAVDAQLHLLDPADVVRAERTVFVRSSQLKPGDQPAEDEIE